MGAESAHFSQAPIVSAAAVPADPRVIHESAAAAPAADPQREIERLNKEVRQGTVVGMGRIRSNEACVMCF